MQEIWDTKKKNFELQAYMRKKNYRSMANQISKQITVKNFPKQKKDISIQRYKIQLNRQNHKTNFPKAYNHYYTKLMEQKIKMLDAEKEIRNKLHIKKNQ